jgi:predicted transglutaminase-like cysteine proteinase
MAINKKSLLAGLFGALTLLATPATALDFTNVAYVQTLDSATSIPIGHLEFCQSRPAECAVNQTVVSAVSLNEENWQQLVAINAHYNQHIIPVTDADLYHTDEFWTYPNGYGDCEDFALVKRRELINAGWPASTLMISVVKEANGNGHAVLLVRTDRGDFVLDNQDGAIRLWSETPYTFIKRQSQAHAGQWVEMIDDRIGTVASIGQ